MATLAGTLASAHAIIAAQQLIVTGAKFEILDKHREHGIIAHFSRPGERQVTQ